MQGVYNLYNPYISQFCLGWREELDRRLEYRPSGWRRYPSDDVLSLLLYTSWVACGRNVRDVGARNVVGDEVGDGRKRGGGS